MDFRVRIPFVETLGLQLLEFDGGKAKIALDVREEITNAWGVVHGGATMTLLDVVMAHAARSPNQPGDPPDTGVVTIEMKTTFMRPGLGRLVAEGTLMQRTASMAFCQGEVRDEQGTLVAHATGTFKYLKGLPAGGKRIQRVDASD